MATFMGLAWIDLVPGAAVGPVLDLLRAREPAQEPPELYASVSEPGGRVRIELSCSGSGYADLADLVADLLRSTDTVARVFVALDHDEYGAEHAVLANRDGVVARFQHVFVYPRFRFGLLPYRAGEPWQTDTPPAVRSTGSRWWGRLVDGPAAWSAVADLYGVPAERMRTAARQARRAFREPQVVLAPFEPWLRAVGIDPSDPVERPVKLWPGPVWPEAATRYAVPRLPGRWLVLDDELIVEPIGLIARGIARSGSGLDVLLHPLYLPDNGWHVAHDCSIRGLWKRFATVEDGEAYMGRLVEVAHSQVMPFLERYGTLAGYVDLCRRRNANHPTGIGDPHVLYRQAATEIVLERYEDAVATLAALRRLVDTFTNSSPWLSDMAARADSLRRQLSSDPTAAGAALLSGVGEQRRRRGLPAPD